MGHMSSPDLVEFLRIARRSLRPSHPFPWPTAASGPAITESGAGVDAKAQEQAAAYDDALRAGRASQSFICVKENVCEDHADGSGREFLDEEDSSLTRSVVTPSRADGHGLTGPAPMPSGSTSLPKPDSRSYAKRRRWGCRRSCSLSKRELMSGVAGAWADARSWALR